MFDEERPRPRLIHEIGQELDLLSVRELDERIALLRAEINRLETAKAAKGSHRSAAEAIFKL